MKSGGPHLGLVKYIYYDFLPSFMLTGCDGCKLKAIISGEEKDVRPGLKLRKRISYFRRSRKKIIEFLGLNEQAQKFGLRSFDLKFCRLTKINGKAENYAILTQQQLELELPSFLGSDGESELNGKKSVI